MRVKIYGYGWVGKAMHQLFPEAWIHDPDLGLVDVRRADIGIVCVPTPLVRGRLDCTIVGEVVRQAPEYRMLIRSTVVPGTCAELERYGKQIVYQPEYLGESVAHPLTDQHSRSFMILGGNRDARSKIIELYQGVYNANMRIRQVSSYEAEVIKLSENRAIAFKIAQCQELYDACQKASLDYNVIREAVYGDDPRFNLWWTFVYPEKRGFNSKCIPKDVYGWAAWAESFAGGNAELTRKLLEVNERYIGAHELRTDAVGSTHSAG